MWTDETGERCVKLKHGLANDDHFDDIASTLTCGSSRTMPSAKKRRRFERSPSTKEEVKSKVKDCKADGCSAKGGLDFDTVSEITWAFPSGRGRRCKGCRNCWRLMFSDTTKLKDMTPWIQLNLEGFL